MTAPVVVWLRDDLRIADNPALSQAASLGAPVVVLYVLDEESDGVRPLGGAARWWLHHSLSSLAGDLEALGAPLVLRRGGAERILPEVVAETGAGAVLWNRRYGAAKETDARLKARLRADGIGVESFPAALLHEPWEITTGAGEPYRIFTPFWRASLQAAPPRGPIPAPEALTPAHPVASESLEGWGLLPTRPDWADGLREVWTPGERAAHARLEEFVAERLVDYHRRDEPAVDATSGLSPHLRFGELSPHQVFARLQEVREPAAAANRGKFLSELGWREFNQHLLYRMPDLATRNQRPEFDAFPWNPLDEERLAAWRQGRTGVPLVDAGMRELWRTGTMHNRVRMVVASFLVKNLLIDWRLGEQWFWDTLVDADEASNPGNWQWVAGSGADSAPYFRVFNPELQAEKFDPQSHYIRRWVPEVGTGAYPAPIVDLAASRRDALQAYESVKAARFGSASVPLLEWPG